jgi:hypothetical protein
MLAVSAVANAPHQLSPAVIKHINPIKSLITINPMVGACLKYAPTIGVCDFNRFVVVRPGVGHPDRPFRRFHLKLLWLLDYKGL